jgi:large repetitive protein
MKRFNRFILPFVCLMLALTSASFGGISCSQSLFRYVILGGQPFSLDLMTLLSQQGSGPLTFHAGDTFPSWLTINSLTHNLSGTPPTSAAGTSHFTLAIQDGESGALCQIETTVVTAPVWSQADLDLGIQQQGVPFTFDLKGAVMVPDGNQKLTFVGAHFPKWMQLSMDGILTGTPSQEDFGSYSGVEFTAVAGFGSTTTTAHGTVREKTDPPVWGEHLRDFVGHVNQPFTADLSEAVHDPSQKLKFKKISGPSWVALSLTGTLFGVPSRVNVGPNVIVVEATNQAGLSSQHSIGITVVEEPHAHWVSPSIDLPSALANTAYSMNLAGSVISEGSSTIDFAIVEGPQWATLSVFGALTGTPSTANIGLNSFVVRLRDTQGYEEDTQVNLTVINPQ